MWAFMILIWRMLSKVLRRVGRWALVLPVAATGAGVFGLNIWTVATIVLALILAVLLALILIARRRSGRTGKPGQSGRAAAAGLIPVTMVVAGACGLWAAVTTLGSTLGSTLGTPVGGGPGAFLNRLMFLHPQPGRWGQVASKSGAYVIHGGANGNYTVNPAGGRGFVTLLRPGVWNAFTPRGALALNVAALKHRAVVTGARRVVIAHGPSLLWGRMLVFGSLLLLGIGLWLLPRTIDDLRAWLERVSPHLQRWAREGSWGILLPPVMAFGMTIFGVNPLTVAGVVAAVVIAIRWPKLAADLVPLALVFFALYGFMLMSRLQGGPRVFMTPTQYGAVDVDSAPTSLLAGVEASMLLAFGAWLFPRTIGAHARAKAASGHEVELAGRVQRLTETRGHALDAATAELRRIERDLHDGAQARLVALGMNLRALERMLPASPEAARALASEAMETSTRALNDLRLLVRGIYPPVLADRGLTHAVRALALDTALPVELDVDLPGRLTAPVESACYFAVAEALANAVKHGGARRVHIRIEHNAVGQGSGQESRVGVLRMEVADDGAGGADPARGTGLRGVERRLGTFDGILAVSSPPGGPTMIAMEVPCELLSPKISSCSGTG